MNPQENPRKKTKKRAATRKHNPENPAPKKRKRAASHRSAAAPKARTRTVTKIVVRRRRHTTHNPNATSAVGQVGSAMAGGLVVLGISYATGKLSVKPWQRMAIAGGVEAVGAVGAHFVSQSLRDGILGGFVVDMGQQGRTVYALSKTQGAKADTPAAVGAGGGGGLGYFGDPFADAGVDGSDGYGGLAGIPGVTRMLPASQSAVILSTGEDPVYVTQ